MHRSVHHWKQSELGKMSVEEKLAKCGIEEESEFQCGFVQNFGKFLPGYMTSFKNFGKNLKWTRH